MTTVRVHTMRPVAASTRTRARSWPSPRAVVTNTLPFDTMGDEWPWPGSSVLQHWPSAPAPGRGQASFEAAAVGPGPAPLRPVLGAEGGAQGQPPEGRDEDESARARRAHRRAARRHFARAASIASRSSLASGATLLG